MLFREMNVYVYGTDAEVSRVTKSRRKMNEGWSLEPRDFLPY